jgi:hypothetical protein
MMNFSDKKICLTKKKKQQSVLKKKKQGLPTRNSRTRSRRYQQTEVHRHMNRLTPSLSTMSENESVLINLDSHNTIITTSIPSKIFPFLHPRSFSPSS